MAYLVEEFDDILQKNKLTIIDGIFGSSTPAQVESSSFFARYVRRVGITPNNYWLFLKILETNNKYIVDSLIADDEDPRLMFTIIKPDSTLINRALQLITIWHPGQIYLKVLLAVLGIVEYTYLNADDGYKIHPLDISELNNIGKYLDETKDQDDKINMVILDILDWISNLGALENDKIKSKIAKHAHGIRMAYFDNTKNLTKIIPQVLLTKIDRTRTEIKPTEQFLAFMSKV